MYSEIKFNILDKVRVINVDGGDYQLPYMGQVGTVMDSCHLPYVQFEDGEEFVFAQKRLELVEE